MLIIIAGIFVSCKKESYITSPGAFIGLSDDTLHFDTVFTSLGSATQVLKIFNLNDQKLRLSKVELAGGASSPFKINVNGTSGESFSNIDIAASDSMYIFVSVTIDPNSQNLPFIVQDSILINYNGKDVFVQLDAYGRNAHFLKNLVVLHDSVFTNELPFVILGSLTVKEGATLSINKGTEIFCHQDAPVIVEGTLKVNGEKSPGSQVTFTNDRLDDPYKFFPGGWPGMVFSQSSFGNELNSAVIKNAVQAITLYGDGSLSSQLKINDCIISNNTVGGIKAINSNVFAENSLIINCGLNNINLNGGNYSFLYCTVASYSYLLLYHDAPVLFLSDTINNSQTAPLTANFTNDIFYGESGLFDDEIQLLENGSNFGVFFDHVLYKASDLPESLFQNSVNGSDPGFANIDPEHGVFDFHLQAGSVCIDAGKPVSAGTDLDGNPRNVGSAPDLGCYEVQ
jgi:hypothetical protein